MKPLEYESMIVVWEFFLHPSGQQVSKIPWAAWTSLLLVQLIILNINGRMTVAYEGINSLDVVIPGILIIPPEDTVDLPLLLKLPHTAAPTSRRHLEKQVYYQKFPLWWIFGWSLP